MATAWIAATAAAVVALMSAFLSYSTARRLSRSSDQVEFVGRQLSELYGPLLALSSASAAAWTEFRKKYRADHAHFFSPEAPLAEEDLDAWKYWTKHAFMPINRKMFDAILTKTDLIDGSEMPECFVKYCAHVTGWEVTLAKWEEGDYSDLVPVVEYPDSLNSYIEEKYKGLKRRQRSLLSISPTGP